MKHTYKRIARWIGLCVILGLVVYGFVLLSRSGGDAESASGVDVVTKNDHVKGEITSRVTIVEYSDFECPACALYFPVMQQIMQDYGTRIRFVYRHFPLMQHPHAKSAAYASEAASVQGKFWEMHDLLFANQKTWSAQNDPTSLFVGYAQQLGLSIEQFTKDMKSGAVKDAVSEATSSGIRFNVQSTPSFFINGTLLKLDNDYASFKSVIDGYLSLTATTSTTIAP